MEAVTASVRAWVVAVVALGAAAAQELPSDLAAARLAAAQAGKPLWVFATASDAGAASAAVIGEQVHNRKLQDALGETALLVHVDLRLKGNNAPSVEAREKAVAALHQLGAWRHDQLPCAILFGPNGRELGRTLLPVGKVDKAIALLREVQAAAAPAQQAALDAAKAREHIANAQTLLQQKKTQDARVQAQAAIAQDPTDVEAWDLMAITAAQVAKGTELAEARAACALSQLPEGDARAAAVKVVALRWLRLGNVLAGQKRDAEALFCWRHAMAVDRTHTAAGLLAAQACLQKKDLPGAVRDANEVLRRDFGNQPALQIRQKALPPKTQEGR